MVSAGKCATSLDCSINCLDRKASKSGMQRHLTIFFTSVAHRVGNITVSGLIFWASGRLETHQILQCYLERNLVICHVHTCGALPQQCQQCLAKKQAALHFESAQLQRSSPRADVFSFEGWQVDNGGLLSEVIFAHADLPPADQSALDVRPCASCVLKISH